MRNRQGGAVTDRLAIYRGQRGRSGIISAGMPLDTDPNRGRLSANWFVERH
ncbi:MAG: DUF6445 family protein [Sphingomonas sp.]